jgi:tryptophan halogenase
MAEQRIKRVVVAGGGTAGWVAATALVRHLGPLLDITLIESDEIGTVGVGESTVPTMVAFHRFMGIDEQAFMSASQATFKLGIEFKNWGRIGDRYIHAFGKIGKRPSWMADFHHFWMEARARGFGDDLGDYCPELVAGEASKFFIGEQKPLNYAYHVDAYRYVRFLRSLAEPAGVKRIEGKIRSVEQNSESGDVAALILENGTRIEGDLFLDCTGFRALLIEQTLNTGFEDWGQWISTNTAVAVQTTSPHPPIPYTSAIAHHAGWQWRIPLQHRVGAGLVFCNEFMSEDEARAKLLADVAGEPVAEPWLLRFKTGTRKKPWNKNVVSLGLASGFIEPLESTSIHLMQVAVTRLIQDFPFNGCDEALISHYNSKSRKEFEGIRDFIILHYHQTERDDSGFWDRCRTMDIPDSLKERMALFRENAQVYETLDDLFKIDSWVQVLRGQRMEPRGYHLLARMMSDDELRKALVDMRAGIADVVARLPNHADFIAGYCPAAEV